MHEGQERSGAKAGAASVVVVSPRVDAPCGAVECGCCQYHMGQFMRVDRALGAEIERLRIAIEALPATQQSYLRARFEALRDVRLLMLNPREMAVPSA